MQTLIQIKIYLDKNTQIKSTGGVLLDLENGGGGGEKEINSSSGALKIENKTLFLNPILNTQFHGTNHEKAIKLLEHHFYQKQLETKKIDFSKVSPILLEEAKSESFFSKYRRK